MSAEQAMEFEMEREMVATVGTTKRKRGRSRRWRRWLAGSVLALVVVGAGQFGIVVSARGWQMPVDPVEFTRVADAVQEARASTEPPEPGAGCDGPNFWLTGGIGDPEP